MACWVENTVPVDVISMNKTMFAMMLIYASLFCLTSCAISRTSVEEDFKVNDTLTRSQLVNFPVNEQVSLFVELPPEMKCKLYRYKIEQELSGRDLSYGEKCWLKRLLNFVTPEFYEDNRTDRFESFKKRFSKTMIEEYGWTDREFFLYTETIMTSKEYNLSIQNNLIL